MRVGYTLGRLLAARSGKLIALVSVGLLGAVLWPKAEPDKALQALPRDPEIAAIVAANEKRAQDLLVRCEAEKVQTSKALREKKIRPETLFSARECKAVLSQEDLAILEASDKAEAEKLRVLAQAREKKAEAQRKAQAKKEGVRVGMSMDEVLESSWGRPTKVNKDISDGLVREQWVYGGRNYLYFYNGKLRSIQTGG